MVRVAVEPDGLLERVGLALNFGPTPIAQALYAQAGARALQVAVRTGMIARLARDPASPAQLATELGLREEGVHLTLDCLWSMELLEARDGERLGLTRHARRWLDPDSELSVHGFLDNTGDYWAWFAELEGLVRDGRSVEIHGDAPEDPSWQRYIRGQYELARLSAPEVVRAIRLPDRPRSLLDVAGAHGGFSAALCRRHPTLQARVIDLPGSVAVGRELMNSEGMGDRVTHVEGDLRDADLGGPHDGALVFNIIHHLEPEAIVALLHRVAGALRVGAPVAILELLRREPGDVPDQGGAFLGLFFHLTSGARTYSRAEIAGWLAEAGFGPLRSTKLRRVPAQTLLQAQRR